MKNSVLELTIWAFLPQQSENIGLKKQVLNQQKKYA
jgi:hypothetical protein